MNFLHSLSDDQTALLGCLAALLASGLLMSLSFYLGQWNKRDELVTHRLTDNRDESSRSNKAA